MGKKVSQSSMKISKHIDKKNQFNSLIKVLRPKVYITDTSNFKHLVQELTGNGTTTSSPPPPLTTDTYVPNISIQDQADRHESSTETSVHVDEGFVADSFNVCNQLLLTGEVCQVHNNETYMDDAAVDLSWMDEEKKFSAYQNLESWLLGSDDEPYCSFYNGCADQSHEQRVLSIYDNELSGLI